MEKISVIIPAYKVEKYLKKCLDSIINQTYRNLEIIVVDDGSPDETGKIADEYAEKDTRIKVIHKRNEGVSIARNVGLSEATGKYIAFADSDDIVAPDAYEILLGLIKKYDSDISFCELTRFYEDEDLPNVDDEIFQMEITKEEAYKKILLDGNVGNYVHIKLFKKELFEGIEFPVGRTYEDVSTVYKLIDRAKKISYTNQKLYYYLVGRDGAITNSFTEKKIKDALVAYYSQYKFLTQNYPTVKDIASLIFVKMYTSVCEKINLGNLDELYENEDVVTNYQDFKEAMDNLNEDLIIKYLEPYRAISSIALRKSRKIYKEMFNSIYKMK